MVFEPAPDRDPVGLLLAQADTRVPELVPIRHGRMLVSPFTFFRGAALPMAADLAGTPMSGLRVQLCGDAHLANFGGFASPDRRLVFDVNDFDETLPGPFEWDVKRLAASLVVAGRDNDFTDQDCRRSSSPASGVPHRDARVRPDAAASTSGTPTSKSRRPSPSSSPQLAKRGRKPTEKAWRRPAPETACKPSAKLTTVVDGQRRIARTHP